MKTSENGINLIKQFEGLRLSPYKATESEKYYTIGYGHYGAEVRALGNITVETAEELLKKDIARAEAQVDLYQAKYQFNQNEYDALVSFAFNIGNICQLTNDGKRSKASIADKMPEYCRAGGLVMAGLIRRRRAEVELYMTPVGTSNDTAYMETREAIGETLAACIDYLNNPKTSADDLDALPNTLTVCANLLCQATAQYRLGEV